jgi:hypothetical protein
MDHIFENHLINPLMLGVYLPVYFTVSLSE